jgi:hypothetical protein
MCFHSYIYVILYVSFVEKETSHPFIYPFEYKIDIRPDFQFHIEKKEKKR